MGDSLDKQKNNTERRGGVQKWKLYMQEVVNWKLYIQEEVNCKLYMQEVVNWKLCMQEVNWKL